MKLATGQKVMSRHTFAATIAVTAVLAICTPAVSKTLESIENASLRSYSQTALERGAPSLSVTARIEYREALDLLRSGDRQGAERKLHLAASLSGDYADPLFTLARIELRRGDPGFLPHAVEGIMRLATTFAAQAGLALNAATIAILALMGALAATLAALLVRYWRFLNHRMVELWSRRSAVPPARYMVLLVLIALALLRLGLALYCAILVVLLWSYLTRKEKGIVVSIMLLLSALSFGARYANCLAPAIDPGSVTRRLALLNERPVSDETIRSVDGIADPRFRAEKDFALGTMLYRLGDYENASRQLLAAVSGATPRASAYLNLGNVYFSQGDYDRALVGYQNAIEIDSTNAVAQYNIGQCYIKKLLFAQAGVWLESANKNGIDRYLTQHPAAALRNAVVYEAGFEPAELWSIARREGAERRAVLLGEVLQPFLLFPFQYLWILFLAGIAAAVIVDRRTPAAWRVMRCDSCLVPTCPACADTQWEITLCHDCASVIKGLSSVKVMEALLRNRRQKVAAQRDARYLWTRFLFPGMAHTYHGRTCAGTILSMAGVGACVVLASSGSPFKDPELVNVPGALWKTVAPLAVLALGFALSSIAKPPKEPRNYRILPPDARAKEPEPEEQARIEEKPEAPREHESRPEPEAMSVFAGVPGEIEKGSKWH